MNMRMHRRIAAAAGCAVLWMALANLGTTSANAATAQPTPEQDAARRAALQDQRARVLAQYTEQRGECLKRFFVNDCLDAARKQERAALAPIDQELQDIAMRGRLRAAEEELRRVQANIADAQAGQPDRATLERQSAQREADLAQRERQAAEHAAQAAAQSPVARPAKPPSPEPSPPTRLFPAPASPQAANPAQSAAEAARARAEFEAKQKAYVQKQAEQARQLAEKPAAPPLPVPPASASPTSR